MSISDEDDDFQSADEESFGEDKINTKPQAPQPSLGNKSIEVKVEAKGKNKVESELQPAVETQVIKPTNVQKLDSAQDAVAPVLTTSRRKMDSKTNIPPINEDEDDDEGTAVDDDEQLAERIRERNLKLARKFSAEIAKNVKASAPIPVKAPAPAGFKVNDTDYLNVNPKSDLQSSGLPPAPPPTPALSSSFNSDEPPHMSCSPSTNTSQYGWRISAKNKPNLASETTTQAESASDKARIVLDRLSDKLSHTDKNLFERVADDLKKVSIKSSDSSTSGEAGKSEDVSATNSSGSPTIPLISDLGNTLVSWDWNSATRLLASASQVTSQVGSVLDSVVTATQQFQQPRDRSQQSSSGASGNGGSSSTNSPKVVEQSRFTSAYKSAAEPQDGSSSQGSKGAMSANEATSNDALVDFTLNAMESLGKKAFGVMTERDQSGNLQLKGLGRPWEHLLNITKAQQLQPNQMQQAADFEPEPEPLPEPQPPKKSLENFNRVETSGSSTLKYRKKRTNYTDDDKLD